MISIGVDCSSLVGKRTGIGRYLYEILNELVQSNSENYIYFLYAPSEFSAPKACMNDSRFKILVGKYRHRLIWLHMILPWWMLRDKIDVFWGPSYSSPLFGIKPSLKIVITIHDVVFARYPETMKLTTLIHNMFFIPLYVRRADTVLTDSDFSKKEIINTLNIPAEKIKTIHLAARLDDPKAAPREDFVGKYILCVSTVEPRKNLNNLIIAYSRLSYNEKKLYKLVLVGKQGWGNHDLRNTITEYELENFVFYFDYVTDEELSDLYWNAEIFVFPSLYEGFGLPVLEAMIRGIPVLCSYGTSLREVTDETAIYFEPKNIDDIKNKLSIVLSEPNLKCKMSAEGKKKSSFFNWAKTAEQTLAFIVEDLTNDQSN
jgi:glycosyltransferase involved in cell wall biosynthesis